MPWQGFSSASAASSDGKREKQSIKPGVYGFVFPSRAHTMLWRSGIVRRVTYADY